MDDDDFQEALEELKRSYREAKLAKLHHNAPAPERMKCYENVIDWANRVMKEAVSCGNTR